MHNMSHTADFRIGNLAATGLDSRSVNGVPG